VKSNANPSGLGSAKELKVRLAIRGTTARIGLTGANRTVPSSRKAAFLHKQMRAFETRRPLSFRRPFFGSPSGLAAVPALAALSPPESIGVHRGAVWGAQRGRKTIACTERSELSKGHRLGMPARS
jgi:hypothetical protein